MHHDETGARLADALGFGRATLAPPRHPEIEAAADHNDGELVARGPDQLERHAAMVAEMQRLRDQERLEIERQRAGIGDLPGFIRTDIERAS